MTTESKQDTRPSGVAMLLGAAMVALVLGGLTTLLGAVAGGTSAAYGALAGTFIVVAVFAFGTFVVNAVAGSMPTVSMLVALMTYTLQVLVMAMVFVVLTRSGLLDDALDRGWLAAAVIVCTFAWLATQIAYASKARIPAFDLPLDQSGDGTGHTVSDPASDGPEAGAQ